MPRILPFMVVMTLLPSGLRSPAGASDSAADATVPATATAPATGPAAAPTAAATALPIEWGNDYAKAMKTARAEKKLLLIYFKAPNGSRMQQRFEAEALKDVRVGSMLARCVTIQVPTDAKIVVQGKETIILKHAAFDEMRGHAGVAIIDFTNPRAEHYGYVVTALPFIDGKYYRFEPKHLAVILNLPPGTLTQRTLVFAVRIHPERPRSTRGEVDRTLVKEAQSHSRYQARIRVQGHHNWENRFPRLSRLLPQGLRAQEVVAESWPREGLLDAAVDCVASWRQSPGHWSAVRSSQPRFGYDMKRGSNGIWYATGLFGNNR